jgi:heme a synthase
MDTTSGRALSAPCPVASPARHAILAFRPRPEDLHPMSMTSPTSARPRSAAVAAWLWSLAGLVFLMVVLGGATRLTESGLSITEWKPVTGVIPPLSQAAWLEAFEKYKRIPQYAVMFPNMTLGHFQAIFLMEWTHRLVGRLLGIVLVVPLVGFLVARKLDRRLLLQMLGILALGGLQGFVGWWMVSSGLTGRVEVAQERLAVHLLLASLSFAALTWIAASQRPAGEPAMPPALRRLASLVVALVLGQIGFGALVAGLRAGYAFNTWPLMAGQLVPADLLGTLSPWWRNLVDNVAEVQFQHRMTAYLVLALALAQAIWTARVAPGTSAARRAGALAGLVALQAAIGILTLLFVVPIWAGMLHQAFAMVVLGMAVVHRQRLGAAGVVAREAAHRRHLEEAVVY